MATRSFCISFILSISSIHIVAFKSVEVNVDFYNQTSSDFKVLLSGVEWFHSGAMSIRSGGETWTSTTNNNGKNFLKVIDKSDVTGEDILGEFDSMKYVRTVVRSAILFSTPIRSESKSVVKLVNYPNIAYSITIVKLEIWLLQSIHVCNS